MGAMTDQEVAGRRGVCVTRDELDEIRAEGRRFGATFPPLTDEQIAQLRELLWPEPAPRREAT